MNQPTKQPFRQGDVLLVPVDSIPATATTAVAKNLLARGEHSGHAHFMTGADVSVVADTDGTMYVTAETADVQIRHLMEESGVWTNEHHDIDVPQGMYRVVLQREYDPYADAVRQVED